MAPEEGEQYRREVIRRLEREEHEADAELARIQARKAEIQAARLRAQRPVPFGFCPRCKIMQNRESLLVAKAHPDPQHSDLCECEECGYSEEPRTGMR